MSDPTGPTPGAVELTIAPRARPVGAGEVLRLLPYRERRMVGPFIFCDLMGPEALTAGSGVDVDAHPHCGLATVSYLFDGRMVHRDSTGAVQAIEPGAVNWMTAGSGVAHTERSAPEDRTRERAHHGIQTWVALPDWAEDGAPGFAHHPADDLPSERLGLAQVRVAVGAGWGLTSPVEAASETLLAELVLGDGRGAPGTVRVAAAAPERAVIAIDGDVTVDGAVLPKQHMAVLTPAAQPEITGVGRVIVLGGAPVGKRYIWWNFVHSDPDRIQQAAADWNAQRWPLVPADADPWIHAPDLRGSRPGAT